MRARCAAKPAASLRRTWWSNPQIAERLDRTLDLDPACQRGGLAVVDAFQHRQFVGLALDQVGQAIEQLPAIVGAHRRPRRIDQRAARSRDSDIDVSRPALSNLADRLACRRILGGKGLAGKRRHCAPIDDEAARAGEGGGQAVRRLACGLGDGGGGLAGHDLPRSRSRGDSVMQQTRGGVVIIQANPAWT
jgi:hypothetical protein